MPSIWIRITWICLSGSIKRGRGRSYFSAWVRPDQVQGGVDNEHDLLDRNGGWDWSLAFRYGSLTTWEGSTRVESLLQAYSGKWYHAVAVFDPVQGRTILYSNGQSTTLDSIGVDGNSDLIRVGRGYWGRTFDGLIDDVRVWAPFPLEKSLSFGGTEWET